jgi:anaerobic C4-dicarboxylate transporter
MFFVWIPAKLMVLAFIVVFAKFILTSQFAALRFIWPLDLGTTIEAYSTIGVIPA